ncbi:peroxide stress protein YaaA [Faecalicatena contorta]|uniref:peroxide stress protein YaaA n=1 Tax=Faecalicatena contorta TaxID=39482 RepID=UPI001F1DD0CB|nr:peroxide stress protein YaaA [Faecalicatena contorta]MCF2554040.1 peroxide stress protein YaaA [Faecalicatena contorta]
MKIIISPAKKMNTNTDMFSCKGTPVFLKDTEKLKEWIKTLTYEEVKALWGCNDKIAELNFRRFHEMDLHRNLTPALISYEGIQYQYMAPEVFDQSEWEYVQSHLRILSGFYGVLKPLDGVTPYRLEMQAKAQIEDKKNLYEFWGNRLYGEVRGDGETIVNLASKEYSKCIEKYLTSGDHYITCVFGERKGGKIIQKGTQAKMARGEMVRYMAAHHVENTEDLKQFHGLDYSFAEDESTETEYVFLV